MNPLISPPGIATTARHKGSKVSPAKHTVPCLRTKRLYQLLWAQHHPDSSQSLVTVPVSPGRVAHRLSEDLSFGKRPQRDVVGSWHWCPSEMSSKKPLPETHFLCGSITTPSAPVRSLVGLCQSRRKAPTSLLVFALHHGIHARSLFTTELARLIPQTEISHSFFNSFNLYLHLEAKTFLSEAAC